MNSIDEQIKFSFKQFEVRYMLLLAFLCFLIDSALGGTIILNLAFIGFNAEKDTIFLQQFFIVMLFATVLFLLMWIFIYFKNLNLKSNNRKNTMTLFLLSIIILGLSYVILFTSPVISRIIWFIIYLPIFSFLSYGSYALLTIMITKALFPEDRGKVIGLGIGLALILTAVITLLINNITTNSIETYYFLVLLWICVAIGGLISFGLFFKWHDPKIIQDISKNIPVKTISIKDRNVIYVKMNYIHFSE